MVWLHENREEFKNAVLFTADQNRITPAAVEKDYYVTLILNGLKDRLPFIVFKGGTSLSKCHKVINRFSEDIDLTIDTKLTQGQNALNLAAPGATGTLLVKGSNGAYYIVHLKTESVNVLEYSEETAGRFDQYYSGAANKLNEYDITFEVLAIESTNMLMFQ